MPFVSAVDIEKALDSTTASGQALIPQIVNPYIAELALKVSPLRTLIPRTPWKSGTYDRNKRSAFGSARFTGDAVTIGETNSTIVRFQEPLKVLMAKGGVTGFQQAASQELIDAMQLEIKGHTVSMTQEEEFALLYGNRGADDKYFNGLDTWNQTNLVQGGGNTLEFAMLDSIIDPILRVGGSTQSMFIVMSHSMLSKLSGLLVNQQRFMNEVEIKGGARMLSYRNVPIYPSSYIVANKTWTGSTIVATKVASGSLADNTYYYKVSAVLQTGETVPSAEVSATTETTNNSVRLSWTGDSSVRFYKIFRGTVSGAETLYTVIPGVAYSTGSDLISTLSTSGVYRFTDTGVRTSQTVTYAASDLSYVVGANYTPTKTEYPLGTDEEDIFVVSTEVPGVEGYAVEVPVLREISYMPLAQIADKQWFLIAGYETMIAVEQFIAKLHRAKFSA